MPQTTLHHLKDLKGRTLQSWHYLPSWETVQAEIADWADCEPDEVSDIDTPGGDFITVDGIPVAYLEREAVILLIAAE